MTSYHISLKNGLCKPLRTEGRQSSGQISQESHSIYPQFYVSLDSSYVQGYIFLKPKRKETSPSAYYQSPGGFFTERQEHDPQQRQPQLRTLVSSRMLLLLVSSKVLLLLVPGKMLLLLLPSKMAVVCHRCGKRFITTKQQLAVGNQALEKETPFTWCML